MRSAVLKPRIKPIAAGRRGGKGENEERALLSWQGNEEGFALRCGAPASACLDGVNHSCRDTPDGSAPCQANNRHRLQQGEEQERKEGVRPRFHRPVQRKGLKQSLVDTALSEECPFRTQAAPEYLKPVAY